MLYDVAVLGAGVAGAAASYALRDLNVALIEAENFVGGRTYSEKLGDNLWANYGAGYFSSDKTTIMELADEVGAELVRFDDRAMTGDFMNGLFDKDDVKQIRDIKRRIADEQRHTRDPADTSLDDVSFADWMGPVRPNVKLYWDAWCETMSGPPEEVSLYGVLLLHGTDRTSAFNDTEPDHDPRGNLVAKGGNSMIAQKLVEASGVALRLGTRIVQVTSTEEGYLVAAESPDGSVTFQTRTVVSALTAPSVLSVMPELPVQRIEALNAIEYGRILGIPVVVGPKGMNEHYVPKATYRPDAVYCQSEFLLRSPTDLDKDGAYFVCQVYDRASRVIWDDDDESIRAGAYAAFIAKFPELKYRVLKIGVRRWPTGVCKYNLGRMKVMPEVAKPIGGISFCGDYTLTPHTDGAAKSGLRAAEEARAFLNDQKSPE